MLLHHKIIQMRNILILLLSLLTLQTFAQQYITAGSIEYEVKTNVHRQNEGNEWFENFKDKVPQFTTNYYSLFFNDNKSLYKFDRKGDAKSGMMFFGSGQDESIWYNDFTSKTFSQITTLEGYILLSGAQRVNKWKIFPNDQRVIAGFNCRKAQTILYDSVYVFAYYTDEITTSGGPMNLNGLPGMILGVTVPRLYTSWVATGVKLEKPGPTVITAPTKGKKKTVEEIRTDLTSLAKSWGSNSKKWIDQMYWRTFL